MFHIHTHTHTRTRTRNADKMQLRTKQVRLLMHCIKDLEATLKEERKDSMDDCE